MKLMHKDIIISKGLLNKTNTTEEQVREVYKQVKPNKG